MDSEYIEWAISWYKNKAKIGKNFISKRLSVKKKKKKRQIRCTFLSWAWPGTGLHYIAIGPRFHRGVISWSVFCGGHLSFSIIINKNKLLKLCDFHSKPTDIPNNLVVLNISPDCFYASIYQLIKTNCSRTAR